MSKLSEIGKYKRLAELFVLAIKTEKNSNEAKYIEAITRLMDHGLSERKAKNFMDGAVGRMQNQTMLRPVEKILKDVSIYFRRDDHNFILAQIQRILESGAISDSGQEFFDLCCTYFYHS